MIYVKNLLTKKITVYKSKRLAGEVLKVSNSTIVNYLNAHNQPVISFIYMVSRNEIFRKETDPLMNYSEQSRKTIVIMVKKDTRDILTFKDNRDCGNFLDVDCRSILYFKSFEKDHKDYDIYDYKDFIKVYHYVKWKTVARLLLSIGNAVGTEVLKEYIPRHIYLTPTDIFAKERILVLDVGIRTKVAQSSLQEAVDKLDQLVVESSSIHKDKTNALKAYRNEIFKTKKKLDKLFLKLYSL